jgi:hypothetical protein
MNTSYFECPKGKKSPLPFFMAEICISYAYFEACGGVQITYDSITGKPNFYTNISYISPASESSLRIQFCHYNSEHDTCPRDKE